MQQGAQQDAASPYTQSKDGIISSFEYLRRQQYGGWSLDKGLLRGMLRVLLRASYGDDSRPSVADFGAGGGRYTEWLSETGQVEAHAFDGAWLVAEITGGAVKST